MKRWTPKQVETFRTTNQLTRKALAELTGVTISSIYQWERGIKYPSKTAKILLGRIEDDFIRKEVKK